MREIEYKLLNFLFTEKEIQEVANEVDIDFLSAQNICLELSLYLSKDYLEGNTDNFFESIKSRLEGLFSKEKIVELCDILNKKNDLGFTKNGMTITKAIGVLHNKLNRKQENKDVKNEEVKEDSNQLDESFNEDKTNTLEENEAFIEEDKKAEDNKVLIEEDLVKEENKQEVKKGIIIEDDEEVIQEGIIDDNQNNEDLKQSIIESSDVEDNLIEDTRTLTATFNPKIIFDEEYNENDYEEPKQNKNAIDIVIIVLVILLAIIIGIILYKGISDGFLF